LLKYTNTVTTEVPQFLHFRSAKQMLERDNKQSNADNLQFVDIKLKQLMTPTSH